MISSRMAPLLPLILWTAISQAIISSILVPLMTDTMVSKNWSLSDKNKYCLLALIGQGSGEILGALLLGYVQDTFSNKSTIAFCFVLTTSATLVMLGYIVVYNFSLFFAIVMCFCWGVQDGAVNCLNSCILGFQFDSKTMPFSVFKTVQSLAIFVFIIIEAQLKQKMQFIVFFLVCLVVQACCYLVLAYKFEFRQKTTETADIKIQEFERQLLNVSETIE
jgi:predicted MFS family arabinose efflux permease